MTTITYTIPGVPLLNQLNEATTDGQPPENARYDCVFTSNAALATAYLKRPISGDQLKDSNPHYGQGYVGFASEVNMVAQMAGLGIQITRAPSATQQGLIDILHTEIAKGHGCIVTMPSQWGTAPANPRTYSGYSHVGLACGVGPGFIQVMNSWSGFWQDESDSWWAARLLAGEVWVATMAIPSGWKDDGRTLTVPNGVPVVRGFRDWILAHGWDANNVPMKAEAYTAQIEPGNAAMDRGSRQDFRFSSLGCQQHSDGSWGAVYVIAVGQDILALETQLAAAQAHVSALEEQVKQLQTELQHQPAPVPVVTPPDPKAVEALAR